MRTRGQRQAGRGGAGAGRRGQRAAGGSRGGRRRRAGLGASSGGVGADGRHGVRRRKRSRLPTTSETSTRPDDPSGPDSGVPTGSGRNIW